MTRLVRRYMGGGAAWIGVAEKAGNLIQTGIKSYFDKKKAEEEKKKAIAEAQAEQARADSRMFMAEAARAAEQYDRGGNSSIMGLINSASRVRDNLIYHSDVGIPSYQPASQIQTQPVAASSGALTGIVSSFLNKKEEPQQQVEQKPALTGTVEAQGVEAQGEEKPAVTGEVASSEPKTTPTGASTDEKSLKEQQEKTKKAAVAAVSNETPAAKSGCKLKKRFNPRQFKKQK